MHSGPLFSVKIILPSDTICSLMANLVELPGEDGVIGVLQNHKPLFANLKRGKLLIYTENNITQYYLHGGIARISNNALEILTDFSINLEEYNQNKVIAKLQQLELELQNYQAEELDYKIISIKIARYKSSLEFMDN